MLAHAWTAYERPARNPLAGPIRTVSYAYDAASNRIAFTNPEAGVTSYTYDSLNRLTALRDFGANAFTFSYDALGRRTSLSRPNLVNTSYTYDANRNTLPKTDSTGATSYSWDFENCLTGVRLANGSLANFRYDPFGRRILRSSPATTRGFVYDGDNVLEASASFLTPSLHPQWLLFIAFEAFARAEVERLVASSEPLRELRGDKHPADRVPSHFTVCGARASRARPPRAALAREMDSPPCK